MKRYLYFIPLLILFLVSTFGLALAAIELKVSNSDNQQFDYRIRGATIRYVLTAKPGNAVRVRATLAGNITGARVTDGAEIVIQPDQYQDNHDVSIVFDQGIADGQTGTLTLAGSGIVAKTVTITNITTAEANNNSTSQTNIVNDPKFPGSSLTIDQILSGGVKLFLGAIAVAAFASLIYSGFQYMSAGGDTAKAEKARKNILWAITGIILASASYVVIQYVARLGAN